jgi:flavin-dependent dehydrogenase
VRSVTRESGAWSVQVGPADQLRARVIVDGTGRRSLLARRLGARRLVFDRLVGVGLHWRDAPSAQHYVLVEAGAAGWWYSAPVPAGGMITMLMTDADICRTARLRDEPRWLAALHDTRVTAGRIASGQRCTPVRVEPATSIRTRRADALPWLAVGDAALAVDPVTGSGVVRALRTAAAAADTIAELLDAPPAAHAGILRAYENERDRECHEYLHTRRGYYGAVTDHDTAFWQRRRRAAAAPIG